MKIRDFRLIKDLNSRGIILLIAAVFILAVVSVSFYFSIPKPFTLDEAPMVRMAEKITLMGPKTFLPEPGGGEPLAHPPLYDYMNALVIKLFGAGETALRGVGLFFYILSLVVLIIFTRSVFRKSPHEKNIASLIVASLYLVNPLIIQSSILIDGDSGISAFLILLFCLLFYIFDGYEGRNFFYSRFILALVLAVSLMIKELTPVFLSAGIILYRVFCRDFKKLLLDVFFTVGTAVCLFWAGWHLYCFFSGTDPLAFLKYTLLKKGGKVTPTFLFKQVTLLFMTGKWPFYWPSAPFSLLVFAAFFYRLKVFFKEKALKSEDFAFISATVIFIPYQFVKPSLEMMKYQYPAYPLFVFAVTWLVMRVVFTGERQKKMPGQSETTNRDYTKIVYTFFIFLMIFSAYYYKMGDHILVLWNRLPMQFYLSYYLPLFCGIVIFRLLFKEWRWQKSLICALAVFIYPINIGLNLNQTAAYTTSATWMNYGERGFMETVEYLGKHANPKILLLARKDICYYLNYKYKLDFPVYYPTPLFKEKDGSKLIWLFENVPVEYFVFDRISSVRRANKDIFSIIDRYFFAEKSFGDFIILKNKRFAGGTVTRKK